MIEEIEGLNLETEHLEEVIESPPPAQPVVVIQYRSRGVPWYLVLPLLILVPLGAVAFYHRVTSRARRMFVPPPAVQSARKDAEKPAAPDAASASPLDLAPPLALNSQPIAPGDLAKAQSPPAAKADEPKVTSPISVPPVAKVPEEPAKAAVKPEPAKAPASVAATTPANPASAPEQPPPLLASATPVDTTRPAPRGPLAIGFSVPSADDSPFAELDISRGQPGTAPDRQPAGAASGTPALGGPSPDAAPAPTEEQLRQDIEAEAAEKAAELRQRRDLKDHAREAIDSEAQARVEDERAAFRRDLREALNLGRREASVQIDELCNRYGRNYSEELRNKVRYRLEHAGGKLTREAKVRVLRLYGVPEPGILDFLANEIHHNLVGTRNGPRDSNEVRIDAAKQLLNMKLSKDSGTAPKGLQAQRIRPAASPAPRFAPGNNQVP